MNRQALILTIAIVRKMMPLILQLLRKVEEARDEQSDGGKSILPSLIETIADALD